MTLLKIVLLRKHQTRSGTSWDAVGRRGPSWVAVAFAIHRFDCRLEAPWSSVELRGALWIPSVERPEAPWSSVELRGAPWSSVELRGAPWSAVELRGAPWSVVDLRGTSMELRG